MGPVSQIFLDCDDTLVQWLDADGNVQPGPNPYGGRWTRWQINWELAEAVLRLAENRPERITIWSGGGFEYAGRWRKALDWSCSVATKNVWQAAKDGDLMIDDQIEEFGALPRVMTPERFLEEVRAMNL